MMGVWRLALLVQLLDLLFFLNTHRCKVRPVVRAITRSSGRSAATVAATATVTASVTGAVPVPVPVAVAAVAMRRRRPLSTVTAATIMTPCAVIGVCFSRAMRVTAVHILLRRATSTLTTVSLAFIILCGTPVVGASIRCGAATPIVGAVAVPGRCR